MDNLIGGLRYAIRQFWVSRIFTAAAVLTLAIGIGGTTAIFTLIHAVMLRSLPVSDPERLYRIGDGDDWPSLIVLAFAFGLALVTGVIFGAAPAWFATRTDPVDALRGAGRSTGDHSSFARKALLIVQATLSVVLVAGATMLARSLNKLEHQDFGYQVQGRVVVSLNRPPATYTQPKLAALYRAIEERLNRLPGIEGSGLALYNPLTDNWGELVLVTNSSPGVLEPLLTRALAEVDPNLTITSVRTMQQRVELSFDQERAVASLAGIFGVVALLLVAVGLCGVTAYTVAQRTNEIGIRMALGADRGKVVDLVLRSAFKRVLAGLIVGLPLAVGAGRLISAQLYGVSFWDPFALSVAAGALALCAFVAAIIPAGRAASISPMNALRTE